MRVTDYLVRPDDRERTDPCRCCGRPMYSACGAIVADGEEVASYWYRWSAGHEGRFAIAVAWTDDDSYVATASAEVSREGLSFGLHEVADSPFGDMSDYGRHLGRSELIALPAAKKFWKYVDVIAFKEPNLTPRVKSALGLTAEKEEQQ